MRVISPKELGNVAFGGPRPPQIGQPSIHRIVIASQPSKRGYLGGKNSPTGLPHVGRIPATSPESGHLAGAGGDPLTAADTPGQVVGSLGQPPGLGAPCPCVRAHVWLVRGAALGVGGVERCTPPKEIYGLFLGGQH